jgi:hypothetical protein
MPLLNFKKRFVEPMRAGTKAHTIRGYRKDGRDPKPGEPLYCYCGARTKYCFKVFDKPPICTRTIPIRIFKSLGIVMVDGAVLSSDEREMLAIADGFSDFREMFSFWEGRLPFDGIIIHWDPRDVQRPI